MRVLDIILERAKSPAPVSVPGDPKTDPLYSLKLTIAHKIKELPDTPEVKDQLEEIEEALGYLSAGKKKRGAAEDELGSWKDQDVQEAKSMLARYIVSMNAHIDDKRKMLELWKDGGLINVPKLLGGRHTIDQVVKGYNKNPAIKEMADDLLMVDSMGKGKGEFMLKVMSPKLTNAPGNKGDVYVVGKGTLEIKTNNVNAAKFTDQNVRPAAGYEKAVVDFLSKYAQYWKTSAPVQVQQQPAPANQQQQQQPAPAPEQPQDVTQQAQVPQQEPELLEPEETAMGPAMTEAKKKVAAGEKPIKDLPKTGVNLKNLHPLYTRIPSDLKGDYEKELEHIFSLIFPSQPQYAKPLSKAVVSGNINKALQLYGVASILNYMSYKHDIGVLFIDLAASPATFTFFNDNSSLNSSGLRIHIKTCYPISKDPREVYPPTLIVPTSKEQETV